MTVILTCAHCGGALGSGDRFCAQCGAELLSCTNCGESLLPGDLSCPECGTPAESSELPHPFLPSSESPSPSPDLIERLRHATLGEFEIGQELGRGGMAAVFLAHEIALDRKVAVKVMAPGLLLGDGMIDRFRNEAVTIANLHHPNIVSLYSVRQSEGLHFFVMRYVQGLSLEQVIRQAGRLPLPMVRSILHQVGSALTYAHRSRVIHRDIKPANILIDEEANAVVTDFGIAKAAQSPILTLTGALVGTPAYMSPEQCSGTDVSWASDQYALGAVAYEMLTGAPPFTGSTLTVMQAHVERTPRPIREHDPNCPPELEAAVFQMLAKDPAERWPRMSEAMVALGAAPLADDDPLRAELSRLVAAGSPSVAGAPAPTSPAPRTRPSLIPGESTGAPVGTISILPPPAGLEVGDSFVLVAMVRGQHGTRLPPTDVTWSSDRSEILRFDSAGGVAVAIAAGSTLLTATCRGVQAQLGIEVASPRADEIVIGPLDHPVGVGEEIRLEAIARDKRGRPIARPVAWQSDDSSTATVTVDGVLAAVAPGFARINAVLDNARAGITIPVLPARVAAIHIADWPTTVLVGRRFVLTATPVDRWENPLIGHTVTWRTSDGSVAVVSAGGLVATLAPGSVVLTATCEDVSASIRVDVGRWGAAPAETHPGEGEASQARSARRRRLRRGRRRGILAAAVGALLAGGAIWFFDRSPAPVSSRTTPSAPAAAPARADSVEPVFNTDSGGPAPVTSTRRPARRLPAKNIDRRPAAMRPPASVSVGDTASQEALVLSRKDDAWAVADVADPSPPPPVVVTTRTQAAPPPTSSRPVTPAGGAVIERRRIETQLRAGTDDCYTALRSKDVRRLTAMYHPATKSDEGKLKELSRILRTQEWAAVVGKRVDGNRQIGPESAAMEFSFRLTWKDAFGGHLSSQPVFRAEFTRQGDRWQMSGCRIVGSPKL
jgi:serine/threonine protein kinase